VITVGIDDTDTIDSRGTNQLARALVQRVADRFRCVRIVRHQLLDDPRVPYTSKNGSAAIVFSPVEDADRSDSSQENGSNVSPAAIEALTEELRAGMLEDFIQGSDPGLCVTTDVPPSVVEFGLRCQRELVTQQQARELAAACRIPLEGLGGTQDGVIGALAAVGLSAGNDDGRIIQIATWPDDLCGPQPIDVLQQRGVETCCLTTARPVTSGIVDVGKHLRPNFRKGRIVLYVVPAADRTDEASVEEQERATADWQAVRFT